MEKFKTKLKEFYLDDLPTKKIYVTLKDNFRNIFFKELHKKIGKSGVLGKVVGFSDAEISRWKNGKRSIPLWILLKFNNLLKDKRFSIKTLEFNIVDYKGKSSKNAMKLKLPIKENEELLRIVVHLICDGYDGGKKNSPCYCNIEKKLIKSFIKDLKIFGNVPVKIREDKKENHAKLYTVEFSRIIAHILRGIYKIKFGSHNARFPKSFLSLRTSLVSQAIKAFADDEAHVKDSSIYFSSCNYQLLNDLRKIIILKLPISSQDITNIKYNKPSKVYEFELKRNALNTFYQYVNFEHPHKKELLKSIMNRKSTPGNKFKIGEAKERILKILSDKPQTTIDLSLKLGIKTNNIRYHLNELQKTFKVIKFSKGYNKNIWRIA